MDTQAGPCSVTPPYQSWGVLAGGNQEASTVTVHGVPVLQRGIKVENMNVFSAKQKKCIFIKRWSFHRLRTEFKCL